MLQNSTACQGSLQSVEDEVGLTSWPLSSLITLRFFPHPGEEEALHQQRGEEKEMTVGERRGEERRKEGIVKRE